MKSINKTFLNKIITNNSYLKNIKSNKDKSVDSLSYLVDKTLNFSQSDCIKLGTCIEKILCDIILSKNKNLSNIKAKNKKGKKETDHLFIDEKNKNIYYAEIKSNLSLDTEKSISTAAKCEAIRQDLNKEYPEYNIHMSLVGVRYYTNNIISNNILRKYRNIEENVLGINEYLKLLEITETFSNEDDYKNNFINEIAKRMIKKDVEKVHKKIIICDD